MKFFVRRMLILLAIGLVHIYVWLGDILTLYALIGLIVVFFRNSSNRVLLTWAGILLLAPVLHWLLMYVSGTFYPFKFFGMANQHAISVGFPVSDWRGTGQPFFNPSDMVTGSDLLLLMKFNLGVPLMRLGMILMEGRIFKVLALFLIGLWAGRQILHYQILDNEKFLLRVMLIGFLIGLPMNLVRTYVHFSEHQGAVYTFLEYLAYALGVVPLAAGYACGLAILVRRTPGSLAWLAPVGKMALSNYLFQTAISIPLYYGIGLGLGQKFGLTYVLAISVGIFVLQVMLSKLWLTKFRFGPVEWLWRQLTYGKRLPILRRE